MTITQKRRHGGSKVRSISSTLQLTINSARFQRVESTVPGTKIRMPSIKRQSRPNGYSWRISNTGTIAIPVVDKQDGEISSGLEIGEGETAVVWIQDNSETPGEFEFVLEDQESFAAPVLVTYPYLFGSNDDPDSVWRYRDASDEWSSQGNAPEPVSVLGQEESLARRTTADIYIHEVDFGGGNERFRRYDPNTHTTGLATTGVRSRTFLGFGHDDENGDLLIGVGGNGGDGDDLWECDVADSYAWTQLPDLDQTRVNFDAWYQADAGGTELFVFPQNFIGGTDAFKLDFSTGIDTDITQPTRQAVDRYSGFLLSDTDVLIEFGGRITTDPINSSEVRRYSPADDSWTDLDAFPYGALNRSMASGVQSRGYSFGGTNDSDVEVLSTFRFEAGEWVVRADHDGGTPYDGKSPFAQAVNA